MYVQGMCSRTDYLSTLQKRLKVRMELFLKEATRLRKLETEVYSGTPEFAYCNSVLPSEPLEGRLQLVVYERQATLRRRH